MRIAVFTWLSCVLVISSGASPGIGASKLYHIETGKIEGAAFTLAVPAEWNDYLLLIAHGLRPGGAPLIADFDEDLPVYQHILADGWMIAETSYRQTGIAIENGAEDIKHLRDYLAAQYGEPSRAFVQGTSMGGAIAVTLAEEAGVQFDGALALGATLWLRDPGGRISIRFAPRIPILFLSNRDEAGGPRNYVKKALPHLLGTQIPVPVAWEVAREDHANFTSDEQEAALRALVRYAETGEIERDWKAIIPMEIAESSAILANKGAYGVVTRIHPAYGNVLTSLVEADLRTLGIERGEKFQLRFRDRLRLVHFGASYSEVPHGEWLSFVTAEGYINIARNFESAAAVLNCHVGDTLFITPSLDER